MKLARTTTGKYNVEAVTKALDLLDTFDGPEELTLSEVCRRTGIGKTRAFRLLHTLELRSYVEKSSDGNRYRLGLKLCERAAGVRRGLKQVAQPIMRVLRDQFNETVNLGVLKDTKVIYLDILETARPFRMVATIGGQMPAHQTAMGKAMLACLSDGDESIQKLRTEFPDLVRELATVRKRGYAIDNEENEPGVACIGCAICDSSASPVAALSISGPCRRILENKKEVSAAVFEACRRISIHLGYTGFDFQ
jgi:IclR family transcriptional regulator, KDG regulon repressor